MEVLWEFFSAIESDDSTISKPSLYNFSASLTLSGGDFPCADVTCRVGRLDDLGRFAAFFGDVVLIYNPFDFIFFLDKTNIHSEKAQISIRNNATVAFSALLKMMDLYDAGIIKYSKATSYRCRECARKSDELMMSVARKMGKSGSLTINKIFSEKVTVFIDEHGCIELNGSDELVGEDFVLHFDKVPQELMFKKGRRLSTPSPRLMRYIDKIVLDSSIHSVLAQKVARHEKFTSTYLTNSEIERSLIQGLGSQNKVKNIELITESVPLISEISHSAILEIRAKYEDSFLKFRSTLADLLGKSNSFESQEEFNQWVQLQLNQDLIDLENVQKEAMKKLVSDSFRSAFIVGASLCVAGFVDNQLTSYISLVAAANDCKKTINESENAQASIEAQPSYFLYKVKSRKE